MSELTVDEVLFEIADHIRENRRLKAELAAAESELVAARFHLKNCDEAINAITDERDAALVRAEKAEAALLEYGQHKRNCPAGYDGSSNCICGWQVVRGDLRLAQEEACLAAQEPER